MSAFDDFLAEVDAERCWLLELEGLPLAPIGDGSLATAAYAESAYSEVAWGEGDGQESSGAIGKLYYSSHGFISQPADTPASTWFDGRIAGDIYVDRRIYGRSGVGGLARVFADVSLVNADGELDELQSDYALDGRAARILLGRPTDARSAFGLVFSGVVAAATVGQAEMKLRLHDGSARLEVPLNINAYAGTGGLEGGADLAGKPKPKGWGNSLNVPAPLVNSASLIYQVHDGAISDVPKVYDRGVDLTKGADYSSQTDMETNAPAAGDYRVWKAGGFVRLGSTPAGTVTADVLGDASGAGYINKTADIVERVLRDQALLDASEIDSASSFAQLNIDAAAEVGIWVGPELTSIASVVDRLLAGVGAFGGFSRLGLFTVGVIAAASGAAADTYTQEDIGNLEREPLPAPVEPVAWRTRVAWQPNYTVQNDLAASVTPARRTFAAQAERIATRSDFAVKGQHLRATEYGPTGNLYAQEADADDEALRLLNLWKVPRAMHRVPAPTRALARDLGDVVTVDFPRHGLAGGKLARVLGHELRGARVTLTVLV